MGLERRGRVKRSHDRGNWEQEDFAACDRHAVRLACLLDGSRMSREAGSGRHGCKSRKVKVRPPSIACIRRLACPMHAKVTMHDLLGCKSHGCPAGFSPQR